MFIDTRKKTKYIHVYSIVRRTLKKHQWFYTYVGWLRQFLDMTRMMNRQIEL